MKVLFVLDHPYGAGASENVPHNRSYTAALAAAAMRGVRGAGHEVDLIDLIEDGFNPVMTKDDLAGWRLKSVVDPVAADYQPRPMEADHLVFAFPVWWESMPAGTKGFLDKVLTAPSTPRARRSRRVSVSSKRPRRSSRACSHSLLDASVLGSGTSAGDSSETRHDQPGPSQGCRIVDHAERGTATGDEVAQLAAVPRTVNVSPR
jgi:multimeric flavodoxin WrbA